MTDVKERETNEGRQTGTACKPLPSSSRVMALHINWLGEERMTESIRRTKQQEGPREGVSPVSISITSFSTIVIIYAITIDYIDSV